MEIETAAWIVVALLVLYLVWETVSPIISPIIIALTLAYILYPFHERLAKKIGNRTSAFLITGVLTILTFFFIIGFALWIADVKQSLAHYVESFFGWLLALNIPPSAEELINRLGEDLTKRFEDYVLSYTYSLPKLSLQAVVMIFAFYGILVNIRRIQEEVHSIIPEEHRQLAFKLMHDAGETLHRLLRGWLAVSILKGAATAIGFFIFGIADAGGSIAAGIFTVIFELLPILGGWVVWLGGSVYLIDSGSVGSGILLALYGITFISPLPDILLKPKLGTRERGVNALVSLLGIFGGYFAFGFVGIIIGPVALSLLGTLVTEWKEIKEKNKARG
ncbi:MAG: hypothetical protein PWQ95_142 [Thermococcaceae archaeon]|nr:hypothetical protein [Thermococcaceae archaeon]